MRDWSAPALPAVWTTSGQPPFIARHDEVAALDAAWADATAGAGRAVFVSGDAGSGKSRLVSEVCTRLSAGGAAVLTGSCIQEIGAPFEPFGEPLRAVLPAYRADAAAASALESAELLERVLEQTDQDAADRSTGQERVYAAVVDVLRAAAERRPVVLALDDLHWAGPAAMRLLSRVVEGTTDRRVLIVGAFRNSPPDRSEPLADSLAPLARLTGVQRIDLSPFTLDQIADYVVIRAGLSRERALDSAEVLRELTGGNPFLLRAMWRPVVEAEQRGGERVIELPDTVSDMARSRIALLDETQRSVLVLAAVLGQEVDLAEVLGISEASVEVTLGAMDAAVRGGLIEPPRRAGDHYRFTHAIARQAIIDVIPATEVLRTHARIAQTLEADFPAAPRLVQRLAHHYAAARALGFGDRAVTYLARAAELAEGRVAHDDAGSLFVRAAEITPDTEERAELLLRAAESWDLAADTARARATFERASEVGNARQRLRAAIGYEDASWRPGLPGFRARDMLTAALAAVPTDDDDPLCIEALGSLARAMAFTGAVDEAEQIAARAVELARARGDPHLLAATLRTSVTLTLRPRGVAGRLDRATELVGLTNSRVNDWLGAASMYRAAYSYLVGDRVGLDESERHLDEMRRNWERHWNYWVECVRFTRELVAGDLDEAAAACRRAQQREGVFRDDATSGASALQTYMVRREAGLLEAVRPLISGEESPTERWAPGLLALYTELELERPARRALAWVLERTEAEPSISSDWPARLVFMTEAALWLGDADTAAVLHPWLEEYAGLNLMSGLFIAPFGAADCYLGEIESLCGFGAPGERFAAAVDLAERSDAGLHAARALAAHAAHLRRADPRSPAASALATRARAIAEPAGLVKVLRSLDTGGEASARSVHGLTAREREVIGLIAEGRSNRDIAAALVISEHTAANHVRNILTKIGAVNRTQAAMFAREHGLVGEGA
ncbi:DNA-binding CsgD family transcriptional regulator/tetratricopeptide (TPR) repeat protein [Agromyces cerinus]|uniref:ATP-binding protein n=1 Tax=Agromyces cerinus TaxID=33878 RepID=UPI00195E168B|nr:helix-turn-helix transcriptional regulator [Agromyces cerinus]MBM7829372.1 DNA-binding CsgD family transcriptional regulator/tetratricopeptide (TPR) repeat protein [Agromyces cerinus]